MSGLHLEDLIRCEKLDLCVNSLTDTAQETINQILVICSGSGRFLGPFVASINFCCVMALLASRQSLGNYDIVRLGVNLLGVSHE